MFLWAQMVDVLSTRKRWYLGGWVVSALTLAAMGLVPLAAESLPALEALIFANSVSSAFVAMSVEAIMANATSEAERGRAAAWSQAGNLGGSALGGGLGFRLVRSLPHPWMAPALLAAGLLASCLAPLPLGGAPKTAGPAAPGP